MKNLDTIAVDLFEKIRGRFPNVTLGDSDGNVTNVPEDARYFDFSYVNEGEDLGQVSVSLDEDNGIVIVVGKDLIQGQLESIQDTWFNFLKEIRLFAKKRLMAFDVRDINKSNLNKRDYKFLAKNRPGENSMAESKMYGTHKTSYQKIGNARLAIKHIAPINTESAAGRTHKINAIYVESPTGERFKYPFKHLSGARAMARHVSEGGNAYDDFGKYISGLSEEMSKLRKFNQYMGRSSVMAETLAEYTDVVKDRIKEVRKTIGNLQKETFYKETFENFVIPVVETVPDDIAENWIDQLTIKQFNEELKDVFPYIYSLVSQATLSEELGPDEVVAEVAGPEDCWDGYKKDGTQAGTGKNKGKRVNKCVPEDIELEQGFEEIMGQFSEGWETMKPIDRDKYQERLGLEGPIQTRAGKVIYYDPKEGQYYDPASDMYMDAEDVRALGLPDTPMRNEDDWINKDKAEKKVDEAYINTSNDAVEVLANLRKIGKSIERGQGSYEGNLANEYANDVWDVYTFIEARTNGFSGLDKNAKAAINAMMDLRKEAKGMEIKKGSGENARFGNQIATVLYPVMEYLYTTKFDRNAKEDGEKMLDKQDETPQTPISEYILSYFDRETGKFPKGETAVLTAVQKEYGDKHVKPAAKFIKTVEAMIAQRKIKEIAGSRYPETEMIKNLAGLN
jgi:hypothetical protein